MMNIVHSSNRANKTIALPYAVIGHSRRTFFLFARRVKRNKAIMIRTSIRRTTGCLLFDATNVDVRVLRQPEKSKRSMLASPRLSLISFARKSAEEFKVFCLRHSPLSVCDVRRKIANRANSEKISIESENTYIFDNKMYFSSGERRASEVIAPWLVANRNARHFATATLIRSDCGKSEKAVCKFQDHTIPSAGSRHTEMD